MFQSETIDTLVIESYAHSVHLATAGEIAISESYQGKNVGFVFIHSNNPDNPLLQSDFLRTLSYQLRGLSYKNIVVKLENKLSLFGVKVFKDNSLDKKIIEDAKEFAANYPNNLEELRKYSYKGADLGLATLSSLISQTRHSTPELQDHCKIVSSYLYESAIVFEKSRMIIEKVKPQKIISFNGRFACCKSIFESALQLGIEVQYHERGATFDRYETFEKPPHDFVYIREEINRYWNDPIYSLENKRILAHQYFQSKRKGEGIGWHSFVDKQQKGLVPKDISKRKIVYFSSSDDEFAAVSDFYRKGIFNNQSHAIDTLISWASKQHDSILVIRVHPHVQQKHPSDQAYWSSLSGTNVSLITSDSPIDSYALIDWSDTIVTYGSTVGVEATYWGKPSIVLGDSLYSDLGCVYQPKSIDELFKLLNSHELTGFEREKCLPYGYYFMSFGKPYKYYRPYDLFRGKFLDQELTLYPKWVDKLYSLVNQ